MYARYFIAHIPPENISKYHKELVGKLAKKFELETSAGYFPTHITLKAPFEATEEDIIEIKHKLQEIAHEDTHPTYVVQGFGHLGRGIITLDIIHSHEFECFHKKLTGALKSLPFMMWSNHEPIMHTHITLAKKDVEVKFDEVWGYLKQKSSPSFSGALDNIALLRREDSGWVVDSLYRIGVN